jgi:predicted O-methyltransferase YrrM
LNKKSIPIAENQEIVGIVDEISRECGVSHREGEFLYRCAQNGTREGVIVEIGSWKGVSTIWLARGSLSGSRRRVIAIDPHKDTSWHVVEEKPEDTFPYFRENIRRAGVDKIVFPMVMRSDEAIEGWTEPISLLWIDGSHEYKDVKSDFALYQPLLLPGSIIAFHDCWHPGVCRAIRENILMSMKLRLIGQLERIIFATKTQDDFPSDRQIMLRLRLILTGYACDAVNFLAGAGFLMPVRKFIFNLGKKVLAVAGRW